MAKDKQPAGSAPDAPPFARSSPSSALSALVALALIAKLSKLQADLLRPLFSSSDSLVTSALFPLLALPFASLLRLCTSRLGRFEWSSYWMLIGISFLLSEELLRLGPVSFMQLGADRGRWTAALALRGPTLAITAAWMASDCWTNSSPSKGIMPASLTLAQLSLLFLAQFKPASMLVELPESLWLQLGGLTFVLGAAPNRKPDSLKSQAFNRHPPLTRYGLISLVLAVSAASIFASLSPSTVSRPYLFGHRSSSTSQLVESRRGFTGQIVVGEHESRGMRFRYLRADHSLLGGLWVGPARDALLSGSRGLNLSEEDIDARSVETAESIYSTFILQELVRLADSTSHEASGDKSALIIGLGAGLSARALHQHQVEVTIVEIDPVVYDFARRYFAVPKPTGGAFLEDARAFLRRETERRYDYIVHDVFTGGSVPASLFTIECFQDISRALTPTGIVAINFAGNTSSVASQLVFSTILSSFHHCRAFEDGAHTTDYRNLVFFCSPSSPVVFRQPLPSDYLPFPSPLMREKVFNEFESAEMDLSGVKLGSVVHDGSERELEEAQRAGVKEHWELMNGVLPLETWAIY